MQHDIFCISRIYTSDGFLFFLFFPSTLSHLQTSMFDEFCYLLPIFFLSNHVHDFTRRNPCHHYCPKFFYTIDMIYHITNRGKKHKPKTTTNCHYPLILSRLKFERLCAYIPMRSSAGLRSPTSIVIASVSISSFYSLPPLPPPSLSGNAGGGHERRKSKDRRYWGFPES